MCKNNNFLRRQFGTLQVLKLGWRGNKLALFLISTDATWPQLWHVPAAEAEQLLAGCRAVKTSERTWTVTSMNHFADWGEACFGERSVRIIFNVEESEPTGNKEGVITDFPGAAVFVTLMGEIETKE